MPKNKNKKGKVTSGDIGPKGSTTSHSLVGSLTVNTNKGSKMANNRSEVAEG